MNTKSKAIFLSALVCPGLGQLKMGKKRGWLFMMGIITVVIALSYGIITIVYQEMPPDLLMRMDPLELGAAFLRVRHRVYSENLWAIITIVAIWLGSIIDLALLKEEVLESS